MTDLLRDDIGLGSYRGNLSATYRHPEFMEAVSGIGKMVSELREKQQSLHRNSNLKLTMVVRGTPVALAVKCFGPQPLFKEWIDHWKGTKARRSWLAASHLSSKGVGTPPPVGYLERYSGGRLAESYFITEFQDHVTTFKDELIRLFQEESECGMFMSLMQTVANAVRNMHDAGFQHNDLGNQNILLKYLDKGRWGGVQFVDLNRGRIRDELSLSQRARDISRIYLPSDFLRVFEDMYYRGARPPHNFRESEQFFRKVYSWHANSRWLRHPVRTAKLKIAEKDMLRYPPERDMWVWDSRSGQAISVLRPKDRNKHYSNGRHTFIAKATAAGFLPVWRRYEEIIESAFKSPVSFKDRIGMTINPEAENLGRERELLEGLGKIPVLIRFYHHEGEKQWNQSAKVVRSLRESGHAVSVAIIQNRKAVIDSEKWGGFLDSVLSQVGDVADDVEIGHAINRVKWGIWDFNEYRRLLEVTAEKAAVYKNVRFMGPAVIDFEYPFVMAALKSMPKGLRFSALSHHLYVDRRGAPENPQGMFDAVDKFALARAIARWSDVCDDRVVVSEVSWPIAGTGVYSPVASPFEAPGPRHNDPSVSESDYSDFMLRYLLLAFCSGIVDRVYWWRLTARGFGLVDDSNELLWRPRQAYASLKHFIFNLGDAKFTARLDGESLVSRHEIVRAEGVYAFMFEIPSGDKICVCYSNVGKIEVKLPFAPYRVTDSLGRTVQDQKSSKLMLDGSPLYVFVR